ncbi:ATP-binding protein [Nocardioides sp. cx-173]|uniref:ATP-binding protein n=1 Tax=Nocardioides sp. cx-173 TaxID=2898796 RepID=UPI001E51FFE7|nr:DUF87 domain-containing protein [Nocardioides sp. cx-173]MCD4525133.1 DUF87 domain-containing protein [Nocardioides sp. cx-173]UGB40164.1 DUF87 domain-containing protein [Nocardioides sp. cx-173]
MSTRNGTPLVRLTIVTVSLIALSAVARISTGSWVPDDPLEAILFQNALLLVVLGSSLLETHFTKPAEGLVNSLTALITMTGVYTTAPRAPWILVSCFLAFVFLASAICVALQSRGSSGRLVDGVAAATYRMSVTLGSARIVFSVVFLSAVGFFVVDQTTTTLVLLTFWAVFMAIWPLGLPEWFSELRRGRDPASRVVGHVDRVDSPGIVRVALQVPDAWRWGQGDPVLVHLQDRSTAWGIPVASEDRPDGRWGTLLLAGVALGHDWRSPGGVVERAALGEDVPTGPELYRKITGIESPELIGFVREGSNVSSLNVEALPGVNLEIGQLVVVPIETGNVWYQVTSGETYEETFKGLNYGSHLVRVAQIGRADAKGAFRKFSWLPPMNAPVFRAPANFGGGEEGDPAVYELGRIPGTEVVLRGDFVENLQTHTAILGVTGSGKTEFAFDLLRHAVENQTKVVCIDLTAQYADRLDDLSPTSLSISDDLTTKLGAKLFDVETGNYGAGAEKKALEAFAAQIRDDVATALRAFVDDPNSNLGLIELREISNTKATLWITEAFLSALLRLAKDGGLNSRKVLVVVEEAHTVMPELSFVGVGDFDSKGTVAKISQIALQGRKYGVGLLVLAQRTATVSKSVLTQCNTVISFSCIDDTSINFLRNVYGTTVAEGLPLLPRLRAVAHGAWIDSESPIVFEVPFDAAKAGLGSWAPKGASSGPSAGAGSAPTTPTAQPTQDAGGWAQPAATKPGPQPTTLAPGTSTGSGWDEPPF